MTDRKDRPKITVIGTGGTLSFDGRHSLDIYEYMEAGVRHEIDDRAADDDGVTRIRDGRRGLGRADAEADADRQRHGPPRL